jgi:hypothetical protein
MRHRIPWILPFGLALVLLSAQTRAQPADCGPAETVGVATPVMTPPPPLPAYQQPPMPAPGYLWTPGYWGYGLTGYYWVPGTWVRPPSPGLLWTPGYWGRFNGAFIFTAGYWGLHVGFYGGINYGFGYTGIGYQGGYWNHGQFYYNRSVNNIANVNVTNVYNRTVINNGTINRVSYNGGTGGTRTRPTQAQLATLKETRTQPTAAQVQHVLAAQGDPALRAATNHGKPPIAATTRPGEFKEGALPARGATLPAGVRPPPGTEPRPSSTTEAHPTGRPGQRPAAITSGRTLAPVAGTHAVTVRPETPAHPGTYAPTGTPPTRHPAPAIHAARRLHPELRPIAAAGHPMRHPDIAAWHPPPRPGEARNP